MEKRLRVVKLNPQNSYFNVALDEALLGLVKEGKVPPTIVFTEWTPTISVGYSQDVGKDVDLNALKKHNATLVRRVSGGQAVYLDEGYIVFSIIAPRNYFPLDIDELRKYVCEVIAKTLNEINIPAEFCPPDNIILRDGDNIRTIGNSGQRITSETVAVHGSIRYDLLNLDAMLDMLMINGNKLNQFQEEIKRHLGYIKMFSNVSKEVLKETLLNNLLKRFNAVPFNGRLKPRTDYAKIMELTISRYRNEDWIFNAVSQLTSKGVCYFYLNGQCIVPEITNFLPYNKPSGLPEAAIEVQNVWI